MKLKDLANELGLSQTTVSRALNGFPEVREATRLRVEEAARRHGYRPDHRAKSLATGRAMAIAHVIPVVSQHEMVNPVFADFIAGAGESYLKHGYELHLTLVRDQEEEQAYRDLKAKGSVDGVVIHGPRVSDPRIGLLQDIGLPFAVHGRASDEANDYAWVDVNNRRAFQRAADFLLDFGHRRIALLNGLNHMDFAQRREAGYLAALMSRHLPFDDAFIVSSEMTEANGYSHAKRLLEQQDPPSAFLVSSIIMAFGVRRAIEENGQKMGRDVSVITHDDDLSYMRNGGDVPIFTATRSSVRQAGHLLADTLIAQIEGREAPQQTLLEAELMVGASTGPWRGR